MTRYINKLDEFQSHSIHYVMLAARSTEELRSFTDDSDAAQATSLQEIDNCKQLGNEIKVHGQPGGGVFLMADTRRFSQFSISSLEIDTFLSGFTVPGSTSPNSTAQSISFTLLDSQGISFANFLEFLMSERLGVSFQGMSILIKILFIGHTPTGETKLVQSIAFPAMFKDIQLDLNETRGVYKCVCIPLVAAVSNGAVNASWTTVGTASSYFTGQGANTLGAVVSSFEQRLNQESLKRYTQYNALTPEAKAKTDSRYGRPVQYMITLPAGWDQFIFSGPTQGGAAEINFKQVLQDEEAKRVKIEGAKNAAEQQKKTQANSVAPAKDSYIAVNPELSITEILDVIFGQTVQVMELGNFKKPQASSTDIRFFKHVISLTSDDASFTVHVDVIEYIVPNVELSSKHDLSVTEREDLLFDTIIEPGRTPKKVPKNFLEFDYLFSSKNLDVLHMDIKIQRLNLFLMEQTKLGQGELFVTGDNAQKQKDGTGVAADTKTTQGVGQKDPILMPQRTGDQSTNFSNIGANVRATDGSPQAVAQRYIRNLSDFYVGGGGALDANITIRGNPDIIKNITLTTLPKHVSVLTLSDTAGDVSKSSASARKQYRDDFEKNLLRLTPGVQQVSGGFKVVNAALEGPSHLTYPIFLKINVFGPNADFITNDFNPGENYSQRLFYNNYYIAFMIKTKIEGSKFTQEFMLKPYGVFGHTKNVAQGQNASTVKVVK